jgi:hypothetical protein
LSLVQAMTLEQIRRSETWDLEKIWTDHTRREYLFVFDQMLSFADELERKPAAGIRQDSTEDSADG